MRRTRSQVQVAVAMLADPYGQHWGYSLMKESGVRSGVLYPMLTRFLDEGWVTDGWEDAAAVRHENRPPRRYYELTDKGRAGLGALVDQARSDQRFKGLNLGWAT